MAARPRPLFSALSLSLAVHAGLLAILLFWTGLRPEPVATKAVPIRTDLVFLQQSGPGGGGGGNPAPAPPRAMEVPRPQPRPIVAEATPVPVEIPPPPPTLDAPVQTSSANLLQATGSNPLGSFGPGGGGKGTGIGPGSGPGIGPGAGGGIGDGPRGPGADLKGPTPIREVKPEYTPGALQAKVQGSVTLEVEVLPNGTVGTVKVLKSLDRVHGLDQEAVRAARRWLFLPATSGGRAVPIVVQIILDFNLR